MRPAAKARGRPILQLPAPRNRRLSKPLCISSRRSLRFRFRQRKKKTSGADPGASTRRRG